MSIEMNTIPTRSKVKSIEESAEESTFREQSSILIPEKVHRNDDH